MTKKQMLSMIALWFFTIGLFTLGFTWLTAFADCSGKERDIARQMDRQSDFLFDYIYYERQGLKHIDLASVKTLIEKREGLIQLNVEYFKEDCRSRRNRRTFAGLLGEYRTYLLFKQETLKEKQDLSWLEDMALTERLKDDNMDSKREKERKKQKILAFFKKQPGKYYGAYKVDMALGFEPSTDSCGENKSWKTHALLWELVKEGELKKGPKGKGFFYPSKSHFLKDDL